MSEIYDKSNPTILQMQFDSFCKTVIRRRAIKQIRGYMDHCKRYSASSLEEMQHDLALTHDEIMLEKFVIHVGDEVVVLESEYLADAIMELHENARLVLLMSEVLGYSHKDIAEKINLSNTSVRSIKCRALEKIRRSIHEERK